MLEKCLTLERELIRLKNDLGLFIICELGDEPQTVINNSTRASISNILLSPDHQSSLYWKNQNITVYGLLIGLILLFTNTIQIVKKTYL